MIIVRYDVHIKPITIKSPETTPAQKTFLKVVPPCNMPWQSFLERHFCREKEFNHQIQKWSRLKASWIVYAETAYVIGVNGSIFKTRLFSAHIRKPLANYTYYKLVVQLLKELKTMPDQSTQLCQSYFCDSRHLLDYHIKYTLTANTNNSNIIYSRMFAIRSKRILKRTRKNNPRIRRGAHLLDMVFGCLDENHTIGKASIDEMVSNTHGIETIEP